MSPLVTYRRLFGLSGVLFVVLAFVARLPLAMAQLGCLLLVSGATGSYAAGGLAAGALAVANGVGAPLAGALSDRVGQRGVLLAQSLLAAVGLALLVVVSYAHDDVATLVALAALAGAALPQVGAMARVRWRLIARPGDQHRHTVETAFSYEGVADEVSFVVGPALVGLLGALISPAGALLTAAAMIALFGVAFALHPSAALTRPVAALGTGVGARWLTGRLLGLFAAMLALGMIFGSVQTGSSVLATAAGEPGLTGGLHALLGIGSAAAGFCLPLVAARLGMRNRQLVFSSGLVLFSLPLLAVDRLPSLAVALVLLGLWIAPFMITNFTLAERSAPSSRIGLVMTVLGSVTGLGYALGSSLAGRLADWGGHTPAFAVTVVAAALTLLTSGVLRRTSAEEGRQFGVPGQIAPEKTPAQLG